MKNCYGGKDPEWEKAAEAVRRGDMQGALFIFRKIARDGYWAAYLEIGNIYEIGGDGVERNLDEAVAWYWKSIEHMDEPKAHLALARVYMRRKVSDEELRLAHYHLSLLPDEPGALFGLGMLYDFGWGVDQDRRLAIEYYQKALNQGHVMAMRRYSILMIKSGRLLKGISAWLRSTIELTKILSTNPGDSRIRIA